MLEGPRQSGKTTLVKQFVGSVGDYHSFDQKSIFNAFNQDPDIFVSRLGSHAILDEVQECPQIMNAIKYEVDQNQAMGRFLLTGASSIQAVKNVTETLVGRVCLLTLLPLSQAEINYSDPGFFVDFLFGDQSADPVADLTDIDLIPTIVSGGFPNLLARKTSKQRSGWLSNYCNTVASRDIPVIRDIRVDVKLRDVLRTLAVRATSRLNVEIIRKRSDINHATADHLINVLANLNLIEPLRNYQPVTDQFSIKKQRKLMFQDSGLLATLLKISEQSVTKFPLQSNTFSVLMKTFVFGEIARLCNAHDNLYEFGYWSAPQKKVDLVIEYDGQIAGIEVKSTEINDWNSFMKLDFQGLRQLADQAYNMNRGIIIHPGQYHRRFNYKSPHGVVPMHAIPISWLWAQPAP